MPSTDRPDLFGADDPLAHWLRETAPSARWVSSVCSGAFLLAHAGLLQGKRATTHWAYRAELARLGVDVVSQRVVLDGDVRRIALRRAQSRTCQKRLGRDHHSRVRTLAFAACAMGGWPSLEALASS